MNKTIKKVFVAMSGGVDSSVAAYLLLKQGYQVTGVFMKNWSDPLADECPWKDDLSDCKKVCQHLSIPLIIETFEEEYRVRVVQYLINGYKKGITPNPDMLCNREIKFKVFLEKALSMGADYVATGHYVVKKQTNKDRFGLYQAKDRNKDQSYFLALLNQKQIKYSLFPIGHYLKSEVRKIAKQAGIPVYAKKDSQGICFIGKVKFKDFIRKFIKSKPGRIITTQGRIIGEHDGLAFYTIGQRRGLGIGGGVPYYVVAKKIKSNVLIVALGNRSKQLFSKKIRSSSFHWLAGRSQKLPLLGRARIRYRQPLQRCTVKKSKQDIIFTFNRNQRAVTPGQFIVLYQGDELLGGGVLDKY